MSARKRERETERERRTRKVNGERGGQGERDILRGARESEGE